MFHPFQAEDLKEETDGEPWSTYLGPGGRIFDNPDDYRFPSDYTSHDFLRDNFMGEWTVV